MEPSINLLDRLMAQSQRLLEMGRRVDARRRLDKLLAIPDAPPALRVEAHRLLADIHLDNQSYRKARRHLLAALGLCPESAETHYQLAVVLDLEPDMSPKRAYKYFRKALELQPDQAHYWSVYGQICLRLGKAAFEAFIAAADLAPMEISTIDEITDGLIFLGREEDARSVLTAARFRLGHSTELEQLWNRFRFLQLHRNQQATRRRQAIADGEAIILPFVPAKETSEPKGQPGILRHDRFSRPAAHMTHTNSDQPKRI